jgi:hypothetical protein
MPRLVTGLFYERSEAERAVSALKSEGLPSESIYLEAEVSPTSEIGRKGGAVSRSEQERRFAGLETGVIVGLTVGCLAGLGFGYLGSALADWTRTVPPTSVESALPVILTHPFMSAVVGAVIGLIAGALIGRTVDFTLTALGAGPPMPAEETLVTVQASEEKLDQVYAVLFRSRARHLHVADHAV